MKNPKRNKKFKALLAEMGQVEEIIMYIPKFLNLQVLIFTNP